MTASLTESQTARAALHLHDLVAAVAAVARARSRWRTRTSGRPSASACGTPVTRSAARFQSDNHALRVDRDDAVGDVAEDRVQPLLLERDLLVALGVRQHGCRVAGERHERLDLLVAPLPRSRA